MNTKALGILPLFLLLFSSSVNAATLGTAFTYQGYLQDGTNAANGAYDLRFTLYDAASGGTQVSTTLTNSAVTISNGLFSVLLDFGATAFDGNARWLESAVRARSDGGGAFNSLPPREKLTPVPYALCAAQAFTAGNVTSAAISAPSLNTPSVPAPGQVLGFNGSSLTWMTLSGNNAPNWLLSGNAGTTPGTHFIGTTDNQPLELKVNGQRALRLEPGVNGLPNMVGGAPVNTVDAGVFGAVIGGGGEPAWPNQVSTDFGTIAGGKGNTIGVGAHNSAIGGGMLNAIAGTSFDSVIAGGHQNLIQPSSTFGFIGGGMNNTNGNMSIGAVVPGGRYNFAGGIDTFAAGTRAKALYDGSFVWADSTDADFATTYNNQFLIRANGGVGINTNKPQAALHVAGTVQADKFVGSGAGLTPGSVSAAALAPGAISQLGTPDGNNLQAVQVVNDSAVGIGTTNPWAGVDISTSLPSPAPFVMFEVANGMLVFTNLGGANCVAAQTNLVAIGAGIPGAVTLLDIAPRQPNPLAVLLNGMVIRKLNPSQPELVQLHLSQVSGVALSGGLLAVAAPGDSAVTLFSVNDPANPVMLSEMKDGVGDFEHLGGACAVALSRGILAVAALTDNAVTLVDVSNPASPQRAAVLLQGAGGYNHLMRPSSLAFSGSLLAIGSQGGNAVTLVNVSTPGNPVLLAELVQGAIGFDWLHGVIGVALEGNLLAIAAFADSAVTLVDVSNPQAPRKLAVIREGLSGVASLAGTRSVALHGSRLAVGESQDNAVTLFDVSDPSHPQLLSQARHGVAGAHYLGGVAGITFGGDEVAATATDDSSFTLLAWGEEPMGLVSQGWLGVGTEHPVAALDVVGNVVVESASLFNVNASRTELGEGNRATGTDSLAAGRESVSTSYASIAGGYGANAAGKAAVALGDHTVASADGAVALGTRAQALHPGTFVWADSTAGSFSSSGNNQFLVRAAGGVGINKTNPATALDVNGTVQADTFHGNVQAPSLSAGALQSDSLQSSNAALLNLRIDPNDLNAGYVTNASLTFGAGRTGEGIVSKRTSGGNQNGLDFYTGYQLRLSIANNGYVGIGTNAPQANLHVAGSGPTETRLTSTADGAGDWSVGTGWTGAGRPSFYLYDNINSAAPLVINDSGNVGIGTTSPTDARLDVEGNVRINDNDMFLRGDTDRNHGLGWYGGAKTFGTAAPDGPVLYGHGGGVLATTAGGKHEPALSWDQNGVTVMKDLNVNGTLKVGGHPVGSTWPVLSYLGRKSVHLPAAATGQGSWFQLGNLKVPQPGPGFFLILATTYVQDTDWFYCGLWPTLDVDVDWPTGELDEEGFFDDDTGISSTFHGSVSLSAVLPVSQAGPDQTFSVFATTADETDVDLDHLIVIFFPTAPGATAVASEKGSAVSPVSAPAALDQTAASALLRQRTSLRQSAPRNLPERRRLSPRVEQDLKAKDAEIEALKQRLDKLERLINARDGAAQ